MIPVDFIFLGPSKTASTWIFKLLKSAPSVFIPSAKDLYYFDKNYSRGEAWYSSYYSGAPEGALRGEICHDYLSDHVALERISRDLPCAKLIICLRNPFERSISSYKHHLRLGLNAVSIRDAIEAAPSILHESFYAKHLTALMEVCSGNPLLVLNFDELVDHPVEFSKRLTDFLGVPPIAPSKIPPPENVARAPRSIILSKLGKLTAVGLRRVGGVTLLGYLKHSSLVNKIFFRGVRVGIDQEPICEFSPEQTDQLNAELSLLQDLLGMSFDEWKR